MIRVRMPIPSPAVARRLWCVVARLQGFPLHSALVLVLSIGGLVACSESRPVQLPAAPAVDLDGYLPVVREQVGEAMAEFEAHPDNAEVNGQLGLLFQIYLDYPSAADFYARARALDPGNARWAYHHGQMLEQIGDLTGAVDALAVAAKKRKNDPAVNAKYADLLLSTPAAEEGRMHYVQLAQAHPNRPHVQFGLGRALAMAGDHEGAVIALQRAVDSGGHFGAAYYALANAHQQLGNQKAAREYFSLFESYRHRTPPRASEFDRDLQALDISDAPHMRRGNAKLAAGDLLTAITEFETAVSLNPANVSAHTTLVGLYAQTGQEQLAESHYSAARELDPTRAKLHYNLASLRWQQGRRAEAAAALREATQLDPHDPASWTQLGMVREALLDNAAAEVAYRRALSVSPANRDANFLLGRNLLNRDAAPEAILFIEKSLGGPAAQHVPRVRLLAQAYVKAGKTERAIATIDAAVAELDPERDAAFLKELKRDRGRLLRSASEPGDAPVKPSSAPSDRAPVKPISKSGARHGVAQ